MQIWKVHFTNPDFELKLLVGCIEKEQQMDGSPLIFIFILHFESWLECCILSETYFPFP